MSKATETELASLHSKVAKKLADKVDSEECTTQDLTVAIKFLKDNNIVADPEFSDELEKLKQKVDTKTLPFKVGSN